ncbi:maltodextrin phosphorylase [Natronincola peptidivorans]|uniref:Alpha-1,4 glucan phosphorylase n=1 Tax=Natronincola peptidivorans TaxID=426128 RepID=A0A1I0BUP7_9FIRM|nr:glycogen/starch/alpha-glucan phosphorylase [Natronincola peptidivorans]SET10345.1 maltodextrin phosphorylase [Natronincola peptidivorans]
MFDRRKFKDSFIRNLKIEFGKTLEKSNKHEKYYAVSKAIMEQIIEDWSETEETYKKGKQAYYLSAEFLMGRALGNNLLNLGIHKEIEESLKDLDIDINLMEEIEEDAGLGNGGLGRLAACFLDSCATMNLPVTGHGLRYRYGIFKQKFIDGFQVEEGDQWLKHGDPWSIRRVEDTVMIEFADGKVRAVPYDTPIIGYETKNINTLRLWEAEALEDFDFHLFNEQQYDEAVKAKNRAEDISRVLYPNDSKKAGKILRLKQQYFFVSASLQDMIRKYKKRAGEDLEAFPKYHAVQLNDTHPVVAIPELMRLLIKEGVNWEKAWRITQETFAYTNHTIMAEALEKWDVQLYKELLPKVYEIIVKIHQQFLGELKEKKCAEETIKEMQIISEDRIHMAWLAIYGSHTINGVAELHTEILKNQELKDWYKLYPNKFQNKTNGITFRRWIALCNKELTQLITELVGTDEWISDSNKIKELEKHIEDEAILKRFLEIKTLKKSQLAAYILEKEDVRINPDSIFDIQIKRLHEYKRQLLNAFYIVDLYYRLKENPSLDILPRTYIFGAKAAPGYVRAKAIIKYINEIAKLVNNDQDVNDKIKVVFVTNYNVSYGEKLFPAADVSQQISTAGKEASGTGNMKFMLNGTPTLGTYDGANVEIVQEAGEENNFIFGARVEELEAIKDSYNPKKYYERVPGLKRAVDTLINGTFDDGGTGMFQELFSALLEGTDWHHPDHYFLLRDFQEYREAQQRIDIAYQDRISWAKKCWMNLANAGKFSSDRTIKQYAEEIWKTEAKQIKS